MSILIIIICCAAWWGLSQFLTHLFYAAFKFGKVDDDAFFALWAFIFCTPFLLPLFFLIYVLVKFQRRVKGDRSPIEADEILP